MKLLLKIFFSWEEEDGEYPDSAVEELRRVGYTAQRRWRDHGAEGRWHCVEAMIDDPADDKIVDAIRYEVESIAHRNGGWLDDYILTLDEKELLAARCRMTDNEFHTFIEQTFGIEPEQAEQLIAAYRAHRTVTS
jgi:hypothetical protein